MYIYKYALTHPYIFILVHICRLPWPNWKKQEKVLSSAMTVSLPPMSLSEVLLWRGKKKKKITTKIIMNKARKILR